MTTYQINPRNTVMHELERAIPAQAWLENGEFIDGLKMRISAHTLFKSPALHMLTKGKADLSRLKTIHLDYRIAIVKIFTDALLMAQFLARDIENFLPPSSKIAPRFLLTLNLLDELGFSPNQTDSRYYRGNSRRAHYPLYEDVLEQLKVSVIERESHKASQYAIKLKAKLEGAYTDYVSLLALLAVAEQQVQVFSPALKQSLTHAGLDVSTGYYHVHGTSSDDSLSAADDDHENDLWLLLQQAIRPNDMPRINDICLGYCDLWTDFWLFHSCEERLSLSEAEALPME